MKIVCFGINNRSLDLLKYTYSLKKHIISFVITKSTCKEISSFCKQNKIKVLAPQNINRSAIKETLTKTKPDLFLIFSFSQILKPQIFNIPEKGTFNFHGGKLPEYRGSSVMNWQIINNESELGISIIKVDEGIDSGPIVVEKKFKLSFNENINDANEKAAHLFKDMLDYLLKSLEDDTLNLKEQDNSKAVYYCHRIDKEGEMHFMLMTAQRVHNLVRALTHPYPGAFAFLNGKKIIFVETEIPDEKIISTPGKIVRKYKNGLLVACMDRCINLKNVIMPQSKEIRFAKDALPLNTFFDF